MKKLTHLILIGLTSLILTLSIFIGCSITDPSDDFKIFIDIPPGGPVITVQFRDAGTGSQVMGTTVIAAISGDDAVAVVDLLNETVTSISTEFGMASFAIDENLIITSDDPVDFIIVASADGYITSSLAIHLTNANDRNYSISMLNPDNLPDGSAGDSNDDGESDDSGEVTTPIVIEVNEPGEGLSASGSVEVGTVITDGSGNPLTGTLTTTFVFSPVSTDTSLDADIQEVPFPTGYDVPHVDADGNVVHNSPTNANSYGFISMNITDDSGREAHEFDPPLTLSAEIANDPDLDPEDQLAPGDTVNFNSFDVDAGMWRYEGIAIVEVNENGSLSASFQADHLSAWEIAAPDQNYKDRYGSSIKSFGIQIINLEGYLVRRMDLTFAGVGSFRISSFDYDGPIWFEDIEMLDRNDSYIGELRRLRVLVRNPRIRERWDSHTREDFIFIVDDSTYVFDFGISPSPGRLTLTMIGVMPEGHRLDEIRPSGVTCMYLKETEPENNNWVTAGTMVNGVISVAGLEVGETYTFRGVFQNGDDQITADTTGVLIQQLPWDFEYRFTPPDEYVDGL